MVDFVRPNFLGSKIEFSNMFDRPIINGQCADSTPQDVKLMRYRAHVLHNLLEGFVQRSVGDSPWVMNVGFCALDYLCNGHLHILLYTVSLLFCCIQSCNKRGVLCLTSLVERVLVRTTFVKLCFAIANFRCLNRSGHSNFLYCLFNEGRVGHRA